MDTKKFSVAVAVLACSTGLHARDAWKSPAATHPAKSSQVTKTHNVRLPRSNKPAATSRELQQLENQMVRDAKATPTRSSASHGAAAQSTPAAHHSQSMNFAYQGPKGSSTGSSKGRHNHSRTGGGGHSMGSHRSYGGH